MKFIFGAIVNSYIFRKGFFQDFVLYSTPLSLHHCMYERKECVSYGQSPRCHNANQQTIVPTWYTFLSLSYVCQCIHTMFTQSIVRTTAHGVRATTNCNIACVQRYPIACRVTCGGCGASVGKRTGELLISKQSRYRLRHVYDLRILFLSCFKINHFPALGNMYEGSYVSVH